MAEGDETPPPSRAGGGSGLSKKIGPLPVWLWAVIAGGGIGLVWFLRQKKSADTSAADESAGGSGEDSPTSLVPINEGLSETQFQDLLDAIKKMQGPPSQSTQPQPIPPGSKPPTEHVPTPPKPHRPKTVTTVKWTKHNTPWNSTLWGIAHHEHVKGGWQYLEKINHMHGDPKKALKPGMKIKLSE